MPTREELFNGEWPDEDSDEDLDYHSSLGRDSGSSSDTSEGSPTSGDLEIVEKGIGDNNKKFLAANNKKRLAAEREQSITDEERLVCSLFTKMPPIDIASHSSDDNHSSDDIKLTDEQASMLQRRAAEFRAADPDTRSDIIKDCVEHIKRSRGQSTDFDSEAVETVCTLSATLYYAHIFVACSQIPL